MRISDWSSDVCSSDLTVLGGARGTEGLGEHHVAALGTECDLHAIGQNVDAPQHARAGIGAKLNVFRSHIWFYSLLQNAHDVGLTHDQHGLAIELHFGAGPLAVEHLVALLHVESDKLAVLAAGARAGRKDLALHGLFFGSVGNDDASGGLFVFLQRSEEHTSELQSLMRISYAVFCLKKKKQ